MYVLLDIEWITNSNHIISPTQIAAMRVDDAWYCSTMFYSRIKPMDDSFHTWDDIAYSGGTYQAFLNAPGIRTVLSNLVNWFKANDQVFVWNETIRDTLTSVYQWVFKKEFPFSLSLLNEYTEAYVRYLHISSNDPYAIAQETGANVPESEGYAVHEVNAMQSALRGLQAPIDVLAHTPSQLYLSLGLEPDFYLDEQSNIVHAPDCPHLDNSLTPIFYPEDSFFFQPHITYCSCVKATVSAVKQAHNLDKINAFNYQYVYLEKSNIFHCADCHLALRATASIHGTTHYNAACATGRRPCRMCKPDLKNHTKATEQSAAAKYICIEKKTKKKNTDEDLPGTRPLTQKEKCSLKRFQQAQQERFSHNGKEFQSETERDDFYTLSSSVYGFFAATGHSTFHLRHCKKLIGLEHIKGFATYKEAVCRGFSPCRLCKPTAKDDILYPAHIDSKTQENESTDILVAKCRAHGYPYQQSNDKFTFETPVGRWMIKTIASPYVVYHINLVMTPNNQTSYHQQPRLFLSLHDIFRYVQKHDKELISRVQQSECRLASV